jgi:hypothetical protein
VHQLDPLMWFYYLQACAMCGVSIVGYDNLEQCEGFRDEPSYRVHRGVNVGQKQYEEIAIFFLDHPNAVAQPKADDL